ncbi:hypothetical protein [Ruminococcus sp. 5_1_39BFAA]|uniref:hypothetical protein n=1 Tax=Ruminococcus sp. 5_1_39BFAA TaxID=457412 RepID=UPI00356AE033
MKRKMFLIIGILTVLGVSSFTVKAADWQPRENFINNDSVLEGIDFDNVYEGSGYLVLEKQISGFDINEIQYAIYNMESQSISMDFISLPGGLTESPNFSSPNKVDYNLIDLTYNGDGIFSYSFYNDMSYSNATNTIFLSADIGTYFELDTQISPNKIYFHNKKALILLDDYKEGYVDGCIPPDNKLCWVTTTGEISDYIVPGYDNQSVEGFVYFDEINTYHEEKCEAYPFYDIQKNKYLIVHCYKDDECFIIGEQAITTRMDYDSHFDIVGSDGLETYIVIAGIVGDDGNRYFSIFDEDGNTVIAPMQLPDDRGWKFYPNTDYTCELNGTWMCNDDLETGSVVFGDDGSCIVDTDIEAFQTTYVIDKENHMICINGIEDSIVCAYAVWGNYAYLSDGLFLTRMS